MNTENRQSSVTNLLLTLNFHESSIMLNEGILEALGRPRQVQILLNEDMKRLLMGFVRRITKERYVILRDARPCFDRLDSSQKKRARLMYDSFGEETFSLDMVVATLDYSSSTASAYLHQFTLLRILDCRKEDVNVYQFLVNPKEHPEVFEGAA